MFKGIILSLNIQKILQSQSPNKLPLIGNKHGTHSQHLKEIVNLDKFGFLIDTDGIRIEL